MKILLLAFCHIILSTANAALRNSNSLQTIADEVNRQQTTWKAQTNIPAHVTISSFKRLLGEDMSGPQLPTKPTLLSDFTDIPEEFDAREQWPNCPTISHIRDQGICGSCWAVASAGVLSDRVCIASNGNFTAPLSDEELLSCCESCGFGCHGGDTHRAWNFFYSHGIVTGGGYKSAIGCQPYEIQACEHRTKGDLPQCSSLPMADTPECERFCTNKDYQGSYQTDHIKVESAYSFGSESVEEIHEEIMKNGPVVASFRVYSDFPAYESGVYQHVTGRFLGGHAVRVIGWGTEEGTPYWLVANSWNTHWGDKGLFKIRRGVDECGIESRMVAGVPRLA